MRILIILHQFYPEFSGGTERVALNLARSAQRAGHYVRILACAVAPDAAGVSCSAHLTGAHDSVYQGIPVTLLPRALLPASADFSLEIEPSLVEPMVGWMKQERFELAHVMHTMRMSTAVLAAQRCGLPLILTLTDFFLACPRINLVNLDNQICDGPKMGKMCGEYCLTAPWTCDSLASRYQHAAELLASASVRVAPSEFVANRYRAAFPALDFRVVPHGIDLLVLTNLQATESQQPDRRKVRLAYVGGIIPQKGLDLLLRALALVSNLGAPGEQVSQNGAGVALTCDDVKAWAKAISSVAADPEQIKSWRARLPLPLRVEEEAFYYDSLYRTLLNPT